MASNNEMGENSGRRTRSGRVGSVVQPSPTTRVNRRTQKKLQKEVLSVSEEVHKSNDEVVQLVEREPIIPVSSQSDVIKEMLAEAAQGALIDNANSDGNDVIELSDTEVAEVDVDDVVEEVPKDDFVDCITYEEEEHITEQQQVEDVEMFVVQEEEDEEPEADNVNEVQLHSSSTAAANMDEKSSSFPFGAVVQSETSDDVQNEIEEENNDDDDVASGGGLVESSLLASLAGDNANSLPSVGGGEDAENKKDNDFDIRTEEPPPTKETEIVAEKMDSDDSISDPAIAEELADAVDAIDASNATLVNTEIISEDELLPIATKPPEINDAEEVSDDELPAPQRAELPADAEVISEDELPATATVAATTTTTTDKRSLTASPIIIDTETVRQKRKAENDENEVAEITQSEIKQSTKSDKNEQYNPMSPTSESGEMTPPLVKKVKFQDEETSSENKEKKRESKEKEKEKKKLPDLDKYWRSVKEDPTDFTGWTYLLQYVDNESDAEAAREAYDAFLSHYPYCYGYWRKYADYEKRKGIKANCNTVFERGLEAIPLSVDLWIHYLSHVKSNNSSTADEEYIRAQFERAINACGLEFRSDKLWDAYIKWENDHKRYNRVVQIYDRLLAIPTQGYSGHFDNFQDLINQHAITSTISKEELIRIRTDLSTRESSRSSKSKERRASSKEKEHRRESSKSSDKEKENKESSKSVEKDKEHKEQSHKKSIEKEEPKESKETENEPMDTSSPKSADKETGKKDEASSQSSDNKEEVSKEDTSIETKTIKPDTNDSNQMAVDDNAKENITTTSSTDVTVATTEATETKGGTGKSGSSKQIDLSDLSTLTENEISSIKDKVISIRRKMHKSTVAAVTARWTFEEGIKRPYFHVKPLERCQLKNWKEYLDFEIEKGDRKRILVLFERCLIACALYDEFWLKMIRYLEPLLLSADDGPEIASLISDVYRRACEIHHPDKPSLHLMWSAFEECQGNFDKAASVLVRLEKRCPNLLQLAYRRINVERRRGDINACKQLYEHYVSTAKNKTIAGSLAIKYARFLNKICHDIDAGLRVLRQTLEKDTSNTRVALQMIDLTLQRPKVDEDEVVLIMDKFMARENIDPEQKVLFAQRKVEFLEDFGSTAKGLQEAQRALQTALNKANEAKKKRESSPSRKTSSTAKDGISGSGALAQAAYNNGASAAGANYNYNSAYYGQTNNSAAYQQQQSYDSYYNQWQYSSGSGYSGYNQWSGYGNYY